MLVVGFFQTDDLSPTLPDNWRFVPLASGLSALCFDAMGRADQFLISQGNHKPPVWDALSPQLTAGTLLPLRTFRRFPDEEALRQFYRQHEATLTWFLEDLRHHHEWEVVISIRDRDAEEAPLREQIAALWERCVAQSADVCPLPLEHLPPGRMVRHGALLIPDQAADNWLLDVSIMKQQASESGLVFLAIGPMHPWYFVPEL